MTPPKTCGTTCRAVVLANWNQRTARNPTKGENKAIVGGLLGRNLDFEACLTVRHVSPNVSKSSIWGFHANQI